VTVAAPDDGPSTTSDGESTNPLGCELSTPVRCPVIQHPEQELADPADFDPLLRRLADPAPLGGPLAFARGMLRADGRLDLCKQGLGPMAAAAVLGTAIASPHPRHLLLGTNGLGNAGAAAVAGALVEHHRIHTLYLGCNRIDATGLAPLAERLAGDATVKGLWLKRNPIGDRGVALLTEALRTNTSIRTLDLVNTGLTRFSLIRLAEVLAARPKPIERLFLGGNALTAEAGEVLAELVRSGVSELYLSASHLGDDGVRRLVSGIEPILRRTARRMAISLGGNGITSAGVATLAPRLTLFESVDLARPSSQRVLAAPSNVVGDKGAILLAEHLAASGLRRLDLRHTGVRARGAKALLAALHQATVDGDAVDGDVDGRGGLEFLGLGYGVPRRVKRQASAWLAPAAPAHYDILAVSSVYR
jgi:Ran GTPase-activating protein (RanGAP) involved in mRNA processing and transport